jgi:hypothetical protein
MELLMNRHFTIFACGVLAAFLVLSAGCAYIAPEYAEKDLVPINTIGILPAQPVSLPTAETGAREELEAGTEAMNALLTDYFMDDHRVGFISQSELEGLAATEPGNQFFLARAAGQQFKYDAVMITTVERYEERDGTEYVVITPASISFSFKLLAVESGRIIWSSDFDQTQKPLFENILRSRSTGSGFRWLTAAELAAAGLTKKLNSCPYLKRD